MTEKESNLIDIKEILKEINKNAYSVNLELLCEQLHLTLVEAMLFSVILDFNSKGLPCTYSQIKFTKLLHTARPTIWKACKHLMELNLIYRIQKKSPVGIIYEMRVKGF